MVGKGLHILLLSGFFCTLGFSQSNQHETEPGYSAPALIGNPSDSTWQVVEPAHSQREIQESRVLLGDSPGTSDFKFLTRDLSLDKPGQEIGGIGFGEMSNGPTRRFWGSYGSFDSPSLDGWFRNSSGPMDVILKAGYGSSSGHVSHADHRTGHASLSATTHLDENLGVLSGSGIRVQLGMQGGSYHLFGSTNPTMQRTATNFTGEVALDATDAVQVPDRSRFTLQSTALRDSSRSTETSLGFELGGVKSMGDVELKGQVSLWRSFYSATSPNVDPFFNHMGVSASYRLANAVDIKAGFVFYLFSGSDTKTLGQLYPLLGVSWHVDKTMTVYAKFDPSVCRTSLASLAELYPYMSVSSPIRHAKQYVDFSVGAEKEITKAVHTRLSLDYTQSDDVPVLVDPDKKGIWEITYGGTTKGIALNGESSVEFAEADHLRASFSIRSNKNSLTGKSNPYSSAFISEISYRRGFDFGLSVESALRIVGSRPVDIVDSQHLPARTILDVEAEYEILPSWRATFALGNLLGQSLTQWKGYTGVGRTISIGTSFAW